MFALEKDDMVEYVWQARQARISHPKGKFDSAKRWIPDDNEKCSCCSHIQDPSRKHPFTLNRHCRTQRHIRHLLREHWKSRQAELKQEAFDGLKYVTFKNLNIKT